MKYNVISVSYEVLNDYDEYERGTITSAACDSRATKTKEQLIDLLEQIGTEKIFSTSNYHPGDLIFQHDPSRTIEEESVLNRDIECVQVSRIVVSHAETTEYIGQIEIFMTTPTLVKSNESDIDLFNQMRAYAENIQWSGNLLNKIYGMRCKDYMWSISYQEDSEYDSDSRGCFTKMTHLISKNLPSLLFVNNQVLPEKWKELCDYYRLENPDNGDMYYPPITAAGIYNRFAGDDFTKIYDTYIQQAKSDERSGVYLQARLELIPVVSSYNNR